MNSKVMLFQTLVYNLIECQIECFCKILVNEYCVKDKLKEERGWQNTLPFMCQGHKEIDSYVLDANGEISNWHQKCSNFYCVCKQQCFVNTHGNSHVLTALASVVNPKK